MRMYDVLTGKRMDMNHPVWAEHNKTRKGVASKRLTKVKRQELVAAGLIKLVPSVTEIAGVAGGFGVFNYASVWGRDMTIEAWMEMKDGHITKESLKAKAIEIMTKPRDVGSDLHDAYDKIRKGELSKEQATEDQIAFCDKCCGVVQSLGLTGYETEVQFATDEYGGTCDLNENNRGLDWKTVKDWRDPKPSEILQMGAYGKHFGWDEAWIAYYHQTQKKMDVYYMDGIALCNAYICFQSALDLWNKLQMLEG